MILMACVLVPVGHWGPVFWGDLVVKYRGLGQYQTVRDQMSPGKPYWGSPRSPSYKTAEGFPQTHVFYFSTIRFDTLVLWLDLLPAVLCCEHGCILKRHECSRTDLNCPVQQRLLGDGRFWGFRFQEAATFWIAARNAKSRPQRYISSDI